VSKPVLKRGKNATNLILLNAAMGLAVAQLVVFAIDILLI
jgi:hypothetical protein